MSPLQSSSQSIRSPRTSLSSLGGFTLIDVMVGISIVVILFGGIYMMYYSVLDVVANTKARSVGSALLSKQMEIVHNLPYDKVGTVNGLPAGVLPQTQNVTSSAGNFMLYTYVRNIDDPFDGTFGGSPNDTAPADYKMVELEAVCTTCGHLKPMFLNTMIAPKNLENTSKNGSLFITVFDATGQPVPDATVRIVNSSTVPTIDFTDFTNQSGVLQLVDVPTSTLKYQVFTSKTGFSTEQTYPVGDISNPNPVKPNLTVASQALTQASFQIDKVSSLKVHTVDGFCAPVPSQQFAVKGAKLIGTNPDVYKYSATSTTGGDGLSTLSGLEWDTYSMSYSGSMDLQGTNPLPNVALNPDTSKDFYFLLSPAASGSLLVTVKNAADGNPVSGAQITLSKPPFSKTLISGRQTFIDDFSSSTEMNGTELQSGVISMSAGPDGYSTSSEATYISRTFDLFSSQAKLYGIDFSADQPTNTTVRFQIAATNDLNSWSFVGPDGTSGTYFGSNDALNGILDGRRYYRYKIFMSTQNAAKTPTVSGAELTYSTECAPAGQVFLSGLAAGTYEIDVNAPGFQAASSTVSVGSGWQKAELLISQ